MLVGLESQHDLIILIFFLLDDRPLVPLLFHIEVHQLSLRDIRGYPLPRILLQEGLSTFLILLKFRLLQDGSDDPDEDELNHSRPFELFEGEGFATEGAGVFVLEGLFETGEAEGVAAFGQGRDDHDLEANGAVELLDCRRIAEPSVSCEVKGSCPAMALPLGQFGDLGEDCAP
jgi:hypothetical protein